MLETLPEMEGKSRLSLKSPLKSKFFLASAEICIFFYIDIRFMMMMGFRHVIFMSLTAFVFRCSNNRVNVFSRHKSSGAVKSLTILSSCVVWLARRNYVLFYVWSNLIKLTVGTFKSIF